MTRAVPNIVVLLLATALFGAAIVSREPWVGVVASFLSGVLYGRGDT